MKTLPQSIIAIVLTWSLVACAQDAELPEPIAMARPNAAAQANTSKATTPESKTVEAQPNLGRGQDIQIASVLALDTARPAEPVAPRREPRPKTAINTDDLREIESRGLLRWLPAESWFVVRVPHVELLGELPSRWGMASLLQNPAIALALAGPDSPLAKLQSELHAQAPELERLIELLPEMRGELVVALTHMEPDAKNAAGNAPFTFALAYSATSGADAIQEIAHAYCERLQREGTSGVQPLEGQWGYSGRVQGATFELRRTGNVFTAVIGTDPQVGERALPPTDRTLAESFAACSVVLASPDVNADGQGIFELYVNAAPGWELAQTRAPDDVDRALENLGVYDFEGMSFALALGKKGLAEALTWCSPSHRDLVSRMFVNRPANRDLARWIPEDATTAGLYALDISALFDAIAGALSEKELADMTRSLADMKRQTGIDLEQDVFQNLGPSIAIVSRGDPLALMNGFSGMCFVIETRKNDRTQHLIQTLSRSLPPNLRKKSTLVAGHGVSSLDVGALGIPLAAVSWCQVEGALLIATDNKMLERCLTAGRTEAVKQPDLAAVLASEDVISAGLSAAVGDLPKTLSVLRKNAAGFTLSTADGSGAMGSGSVVVLPILASIAIPKLMSARISANEAAAFSSLRHIGSAEAQTQSSGAIDLDGDGVGEYAFLGEMAGTIPLRGTSERLEPAVLNKPLGATKDGTATHTGYHYRIYLPAANGSGALCESKASDGKDVSAERAEASFTAYAWPVDAGTTANRVWVMHNYLLYECEDPNGEYSGLEHAPRYDSSWPAERGVDREDGTPYVGKDGLTWQLVE